MYFNGLPENRIEGIYIENAKISARTGGEIKESKNVVLKNIVIKVESGPEMKISNCKDIQTENVPGKIEKL